MAPGIVSGAGAPDAALDVHGVSLRRGLCQACRAASVHAQEPRGPAPGARGGCLDARSGSWTCGARRPRMTWAAPPPRLQRTGARHTCSRPVAEDGMRGPRGGSVAETREALHAPAPWRAHLQTGVVQTWAVCTA
jgi:hypothetical protein